MVPSGVHQKYRADTSKIVLAHSVIEETGAKATTFHSRSCNFFGRLLSSSMGPKILLRSLVACVDRVGGLAAKIC